MTREPMPEWIQRLNEPQEFYRRMAARQEEDPLTARYQRIVDQIVERDRMIEALFVSDEVLVNYIRHRPSRSLILRRMRRELKAKRGLVRRLARAWGEAGEGVEDVASSGPSILGWRPEASTKVPDLPSLAERLSRWRPDRPSAGTAHNLASGGRLAKDAGRNDDDETVSLYWAAALQNMVKIHPVLPEIPENLSLCGYQQLFSSDFYRTALMTLQKVASQVHRPGDLQLRQQLDKLERLYRQWMYKRYALRIHWQAFTGRELDFSNLPWLRDIGKWKAPVPSRLGWSNELYSLEARRMGHRPALGDDTSGASNPGDPAPRSQAAARDPVQADDGCEIERLYELAGGRLPRQPGEGDKLYTFPGTLNRHENIFYDYSIIIPVDCTDQPCMDTEEGTDPRDLLPARVLAGKAKSVLLFLDQVGLAQTLGHYPKDIPPDPDVPHRKVTEDINDLLNEVLDFDEGADVSEARQIRKKLRKMAGLMRLVSRTEMFLTELEGADPVQFLNALDEAVDKFPYFDWAPTDMPTHEEGGRKRPALTFPDGTVYVPDAHLVGVTDKDWKWRWDEEQVPLRAYIEWLGDGEEGFLKHLGALFGSAKAMRDAVRSFSGNYQEFQSGFERLAEGLVNSAANALSQLLEAIADQIPLPKDTRGEGSLRLGLQVVYRQTWFPVAYVMGKLVGFKNLIPNQKETIHRRTFVKTVTETTTAEEFATARQDDYSHSQKETSEVVKEASREFGFTQNATGHFDVKIWGVEGETQIDLGLEDKSKTVQNMVSESTTKGSATFSEKREVKVRELAEAEDVQEVTSELQNLNQEITANYFYYQLLREYRVTVALEDLRPVLLRTRDVPSPTEIDDKFLSAYAHILLHHLPAQLATDAQESADQLDILARTLIRRRAEMDQRSADLELFRAETVDTTDTAAVNQHREELYSKERLLTEARQDFIAAEQEYTRVRAKMDRVLKHLQENICHYMQFIWHESPQVDQDMLLREESFCGSKLPDVTRGLLRQGYYGNEEIFDYTGPSSELFEAILLNLRPGDEIVYGLMDFVEEEPLQTGTTGEQQLAHHYIYHGEGEEDLNFSANATVEGDPPQEGIDYIVNYSQGTITFLNPLDDADPGPTVSYVTYEDLAETSLYQYLARYYATEDMDALLDTICNLAFTEDPAHPFIEDPASPEEYLTTRNVQIPQDALVVETMPGQVPLLEGFQMAHRMLDVQKACLENLHLTERIASKPWETAGEDTYKVERVEGTGKEAEE